MSSASNTTSPSTRTRPSRDLFHARGLPTSVVFNRDGTVAFTWVGPIPEGDPTFLEGVEGALGG